MLSPCMYCYGSNSHQSFTYSDRQTNLLERGQVQSTLFGFFSSPIAQLLWLGVPVDENEEAEVDK